MLEVKNLSKVYKPKKGTQVVALNKVNLAFAEKGLVFLLGKSGSGKSTLLNLMGGLDSITGGEIIIKGKSSAEFKQSDFDSYRNTFIGFIFQEFYIIEEYSVGRNIGLALELQHQKADDAAINAILQQVDLEGFKDRRPNELSGGQKQRVAIARALIKNPEIIMADEPTGSLDSKTGAQVFETLKKLSQNKLVVVVSHDRENAEVFGDRIIELADGIVINDRIRQESGVFLDQPINIIDDKFIHIQKGYQFNTEDSNRLSALIRNSETDVVISFDEKTNSSLVKTGKRDKSFAPTTAANNPVKQYNPNDLKMVKSKLPLKDSLRMGASGLKLKKFRLGVTIFLSLIAFIMFGISVVASAFDPVATNLKTMYDDGTQSLTIQNQYGRIYSGNDRIYYSAYESTGFDADQLKEIERISGKKPLNIVNSTTGDYYNNYEINLTNNFKNSYGKSIYYARTIKHLLEVDNPQNANLTALAGQLPTDGTGIAITDYIADSFLEYGYKEYDQDSDKGITISSYNELIGKKLYTTNYGELTITGIFKTDMNKSKYDSYKKINIDENNFAAGQTIESLQDLIISMGFVIPNFKKEVLQNAKIFETINNIYFYNSNDLYGNYNRVAVLSALDSSKISWKSGHNSQLSNDEIILPQSFWKAATAADIKDLINGDFVVLTGNNYETQFKAVGFYDDSEYSSNDKFFIFNENNFKKYAATQVYSKYSFVNQHLSPFYGKMSFCLYTGLNLGITWVNDTPLTSLKDNEIIISYQSLNDSLRDLQYEEILTRLNKECTLEIVETIYDKNGIVGNNTIDTIGGTYKIVGISYNDQTYISEKLYNDIFDMNNVPSAAIVMLSGNYNKDIELFKYLDSSEIIGETSATKIKPLTALTFYLDLAESIVDVFKNVFLWLGIAFSVFAGLMLMNFIGVSISHKKKDIGILRAIGARSWDVFMIFFNESLMIGTISLVLSIVGVLVLCMVINTAVGFALLIPGILHIALMAILCYGISALTTFIAIRKIARKKPIDAINDR